MSGPLLNFSHSLFATHNVTQKQKATDVSPCGSLCRRSSPFCPPPFAQFPPIHPSWASSRSRPGRLLPGHTSLLAVLCLCSILWITTHQASKGRNRPHLVGSCPGSSMGPVSLQQSHHVCGGGGVPWVSRLSSQVPAVSHRPGNCWA